SSVPSSTPSSAASDSSLSDISDSELSIMSRSLARASRRSYPSPSSSNRSSAKASPAPENMPSPPPSNDDDDRPRKKRKLDDPKERTTHRLDLRKDLTEEDQPQLDRLLKTLHKKRKIVVIAGAGISVSAGIPDFRSSTGLFKSLRDERKRISSGKELFDASVYQNDSSTSSFHDMVRTLSQQTKNAEPTAFHHLLATLAHEGRLLRLYTQNVDGIDTSLPPLKTEVPLPKKNPWPKTVQLHGSLEHMVCSKCHTVSDFDPDLFDGPAPPACPSCQSDDLARQAVDKRSHGVGRLRPRMVLYNEHNPDDEAIGACSKADLRTRPDAVIVVGTTLKVPGVRRIVREMCATVRDRKDGTTIWINNDPEPKTKELENVWDLVVQGPCDEVARYAAMQKWDDPAHKEVTDDELPKHKPFVVIGTPKKGIKVQGMLTPAQSPRIGPQSRIKLEYPVTPSKTARGAKRTSEGVAKTNAFAQLNGKPAAKSQTKRAKGQPKKATAAKAKTRKTPQQVNAAITNSFKQKKSTARSVPAKLTSRMATMPRDENADTIDPPKGSPLTPQQDGRKVRTWALSKIPAGDLRNNDVLRPEVELFSSPAKPRTPSEQLRQEDSFFREVPATDESRPSSSAS
ncbi:DHS-like NAD/FAD-binding domain-containing protein, partial [Bimuria novae-zelandiae CBS 107.79]